MQKPKHPAKPSVSQDSQLSSTTALHPHSHAAHAQQQNRQEEEEVSSPLQLGNIMTPHMATGQHAQSLVPSESQPMQLDTDTEQNTDMEVDSTADVNAAHMQVPALHSATQSDQGYAARCGWPQGRSHAEPDRCDWPQGGSHTGTDCCDWPKAVQSFSIPMQQHAAMQGRGDAGQHATVSGQSVSHELGLPDGNMHSGGSPVPSMHEGQHGAALGQHGHTGLWQGQLGDGASQIVPTQLAASPAALLSLMQQANVPQGKRKQAGTIVMNH